MKFHSIFNQGSPVAFREALLRGLAPDGSLYIPERIPRLPASLLQHLPSTSLHAIGYDIASTFIDEIPAAILHTIVKEAWNFPIPLVKLDDKIFLLELFHGPTLAFKDVGARFMAQTLSFFMAQERRQLTIVVATSGDTGSAVAHGFAGVPNLSVFILYPAGKVSRLQEQQMTTLGGNIHAVEVDGTFDDCQRLVKESLADHELLSARPLTTANSINLGRLLPQIAYYVWALAQWQREHGKHGMTPTVVVPSGNLGNLTAAVYAKWMGIPIGQIVAATNINDVVPHYFATGSFIPRPSRATFSNAMDVGNPSNLARLQALYGNNVQRMRGDIDAVAITDDETLSEIRRTYASTGYILDPHTAVGMATARLITERTSGSKPLIVAATAHPAKFPEVVRRAIGIDIPLPPTLTEALRRKKQSTPMAPVYKQWKELLISGI